MANIILCSNSECKKASYCLRHMGVTLTSKKYDDFRGQGCKDPTYYSFITIRDNYTPKTVVVEHIWKEIRDKEFKRK